MSEPRIGILGGGAFGTALAVALARDGRQVTLWARDPGLLAATRQSPRLPGVTLPDSISITGRIPEIAAPTLLLAVPMQSLGALLAAETATLDGRTLVACCKGVDLVSLTGPAALIARHCPASRPAILTGPSFAADLARGLPTALTLATIGPGAPALQALLSTATLRLYLSDDLTGAELGGALKNVIAIACGAVIGAGWGESARAATMTRGFAEMTRLAAACGARAETLAGLSGLGDLALTCTSEQSRNYRAGLALGRGAPLPEGQTIEGAATARAAARLGTARGVDLPLTRLVAALADGHTSIEDARADLLSRPLREE